MSLGISGGADAAWVILAIALVFLVGFLSIIMTGRPTGILIDSRNMMNLMHLQLAAWTIIVCSALWVTAEFNLKAEGYKQAFDVGMHSNLLILLFIVLGSYALNSTILSIRLGQSPTEGNLENTKLLLSRLQGDPLSTLSSQGDLLVKIAPSCAKWNDLFRGDTISNGAYLNPAKVQNVFISAVIFSVYCVELWDMFSNAEADGQILELPAISSGLVWLFAASHLTTVISSFPLRFARPQPPAEPTGAPERTAFAAGHPYRQPVRSAARAAGSVLQTRVDRRGHAVGLYQIYRDYIIHEDHLINHRTTWLIGIQSFLLATFGVSYVKYYELATSLTTAHAHIDYDRKFHLFLYALCAVGFMVGAISAISISAATLALGALRSKWDTILRRERFRSDFPGVTGGGSQLAEWLGFTFPLLLPSFFAGMWSLAFVLLKLQGGGQ